MQSSGMNQDLRAPEPSGDAFGAMVTPPSVLPAEMQQVTVSGSPYSQGLAHGRILRAQIEKAVDLYSTLFRLNHSELAVAGERVLNTVKSYYEPYVTMMEGIAEGSDISLPLIAALNARTELLHNAKLAHSECTSVFIPDSSGPLLAQNWDWMKALDPLMFIMHAENTDGLKIATLTEPGIIGKLGMNSAGIGVCLNILPAKEPCHGVPVHVLLRAVLDSHTLEEAKHRILSARIGTASSIVVADANGDGFCAEFNDSHLLLKHARAQPMIRTNHHLYACSEVSPFFLDSVPRMERATEILSHGPKNLQTVLTILGDKLNTVDPICMPFSDEGPPLGLTGTLATVVMKLQTREMTVTTPNTERKRLEIVLN